MAKGKVHHIFVSSEGNDDNDGSEQYPFKTTDRARKAMELRGRCTGIRVLGSRVLSSPCGTPRCGACTKANGRRLCPGEGCDKWISVSAKQHPDCGWRKQEAERRPKEKVLEYRPEDNHGFEKVKRKIMQLAMQAAMQYGWDGIILGYAAKVGRGGSTGRIAFVSPQNELYTIDDRGAIKTHATLEPNLAQNAENALTLIRQKICPTERAHLMIKHDAPPMMEAMEMAGHLQAVQGPELPHALDDKHEMSGPEMQWLQQNMDKSGPMMHPALLNLGQPLPMHPQALHGAGVGSAMSHSMAMPLGPGLGHPMGQPSHLAAAHMQGAHMGGPLGSAAQAMGAMQMQMHGHVAHTVDMNMESVSKRMRGDE